MKRRHFITALGTLAVAPVVVTRLAAREVSVDPQGQFEVKRTDAEWRATLSPAQYEVLRNEGTERPWTSPLNAEKRDGTYACAGCGQALFTSDLKYDSGTGWPSFFDVIEGAVETKLDFKLLLPRTEYHCSRCGGHQGHVFKDGPKPTGLRYCNNGVAMNFVPTSE